MCSLATPPWLRWDPQANHDLTWSQNIIYACVAAFSVGNIYYSHPILDVLADDFDVSDERASLVPTIMQAGYAGGLLFIIPFGDIIHRRPMILALVLVTALFVSPPHRHPHNPFRLYHTIDTDYTQWLGLTLTKSFSVFLGLSFVVGMLTVTPQLMFPIAVQYAPSRHRATMISIVMSGIIFGILVARLLSGVITQYSSWRNVYWLSLGLQALIFTMLFVMMPDYPVLRPGGSYARALLTILKLPLRHPVLMQSGLIAFMTMGMFTSFWTTLTFQLVGPTFRLSTLTVALFALIGIAPVFLSPLVSRYVTSRIHPMGTLLLAHVVATIPAVAVGTFVGTYSLAGPVIWAFLGDLGMTVVVVANRMAIASVDPKAQNAVNSVYMVITFCGQLFGTAMGNRLYAEGGWIHSGALSIGMVGLSLVITLVRGPHEKGWVGWRGGWDLSNKTKVRQEGLETPQERPGQDDVAGGIAEQQIHPSEKQHSTGINENGRSQ
ncbi:MFS general substrate transporter [Apiospora kogelbergensis]|uniref:MFS general substrate transporter n=1 Tax=Apiospora kogelbergensis TaxID=1337665 RepID=A0AAW0R0E9_9PEZI